MDILTCMSLGGSLMVIFYILIKKTCRSRFSYKERRLFVLVTMGVFMIPYPQERHHYLGFLQWLFPNAEWVYSFNDPFYEFKYYIITNQVEEIIFRKDIRIYLIAAFILIGFIIIFVRQLYLNQKYKNKWMCFGKEELPRKIWRKEVMVFSSKEVETPLSAGIFNPIVVIPEEALNEKEKEMIITHELEHIRRGDLFFNCFCVILISVHWINPLVYYLVNELHHLQELRCDSKLVRGMNEEERCEYASLILRFMQKRAEKRPFVSALSGSGKRVKERVDKIINGEKAKVRIFMVMILLICTFMSTFTALAYEPVENIEMTDEMLAEIDDLEEYCEKQKGEFVSEGEESLLFSDETIGLIKEGKSVFKADDRVYYFDEGEINIHTTKCEHDGESGKYYTHVESETECTVEIFGGTYCMQCGMFMKEDRLNVIIFEPCMHY